MIFITIEFYSASGAYILQSECIQQIAMCATQLCFICYAIDGTYKNQKYPKGVEILVLRSLRDNNEKLVSHFI